MEKTPKENVYLVVVGAAFIALCCFAPLLVIGIGTLSLSAFIPYLIYPALAILLLVAWLAYRKYKKSKDNNK